jgi:hypothetical protein
VKPELQKALFDLAPDWFDRGDPKHSLMCFGFECGDGWFFLLRDLITDLKTILGSTPFTVAQVKEKFGGLRFYTGGVPSAIYEQVEERIDAAEALSLRTCEVCGRDGKTYNDGWSRTLCPECEAEREKEKHKRTEKLREYLDKYPLGIKKERLDTMESSGTMKVEGDVNT